MGGVKINALQALLELALSVPMGHAFNIRLAACECIKAYLYQHTPIRLHFLNRARAGHLSSNHESDNILTILLEGPGSGQTADPYRHWAAAVILFNLLYEDPEAKHIAMEITEGDGTRGEEVITCIQALSVNLIAGVQRGDNDHIIVGYFMVLSGWLYEDSDAVDDFLGEGSNVQSLVQLAMLPSPQHVLVPGLCAFLLSIVYEFSSKDSPIPRQTLYEILATRLGRELLSDRMTKLREHPLIREFEVLPSVLTCDQVGNFPDVYFDKIFVDFFKDNFSRILRAIDREPGIEVSSFANGIRTGISRELVDSLKSQLDDCTQALHTAESTILDLERRFDQEQVDHKKSKESAVIELTRIGNINLGLQGNYDEDLQRIHESNRQALSQKDRASKSLVIAMQAEYQRSMEAKEAIVDDVRAKYENQIRDLKLTLQDLEGELDQVNRTHQQDLQRIRDGHSAEANTLRSRLEQAEQKRQEAVEQATVAQSVQEQKEAAWLATQTELDDLFIVLGDLEEKRARDKVRTCPDQWSAPANEDRDDFKRWVKRCLMVTRKPIMPSTRLCCTPRLSSVSPSSLRILRARYSCFFHLPGHLKILTLDSGILYSNM